MEPMVGNDAAPSDAELISRVRDGDRAAFGELYSRHARAAAALARQISVSGAEADDLVAESFARVLDTMLDGRGPDSAFRAYLFTTLRHTAYDRTRKDKRLQFTDDITAHEVAVESDDPVLLQMENSFVAKAFTQLPERWRTILWHTQVEGQSPAEVGVLLGMSANAVTSLAFRAREGLREAYLQVHMAETVAERCRTTIDRLGAYTRGGLSKRETAQVQAHLAECDRCPELAAELSEINSGLRGLLAPLLLGSAAAGYIATLPPVPALTQVGATVVTAGSTLVKIGAAARFSSALSPAVVTGGVMAAAVATVIAVVVGLVSSPGTQTADPLNAVTTSRSTGAGTQQQTTNAAPTAEGTGSDLAIPSDTVSVTSAEPTDPGEDFFPPIDGDDAPTVDQPTPALPTDATPTTDPTTAPSTAPTTATSDPDPAPGGDPDDGQPAPTTPVVTPPNGTPGTTAPAAPAVVNVNVTNGINTLTAGGSRTLSLTATNSGGTIQPAGTVVLDAGQGVSLVGANVAVAAFRPRSVAFAARVPEVGAIICTDNVCPLPELAPGASAQISLQVDVAPSATATDLSWTLYDLAPIVVTDVPVQSGFASVAIVPAGTVTAGTNTQFVLTATPAEGVTNPGPVTLPTALSTDLYVSGTPEGCVLGTNGTEWQCQPDANGQVGPLTLDTVATPSASGDQTLAVSDAGGRALASDTPVTVVPLDSGASVTMTGPFGGTVLGGDTIYCSDPNSTDRSACGPDNTGMVLRDPAAAPTLDLQGHSVVWAELTWATAGLTGDDTVTLNVDGAPTSVTGTALTPGASDTGRMSAYRQDVTSLISGNGAISISDLAASTTTIDNTTPFGVWALVVIWADPLLPDNTITYTNSTARSLPTVNTPSAITIADSPGLLTDMYVTLWASDPWGVKSISYGGTKLPTTPTGSRVDPATGLSYQTGFDLLYYGPDQLRSLTGPVVLTNSADRVKTIDGLWVGPVLTIGPSGPPTDQ